VGIGALPYGQVERTEVLLPILHLVEVAPHRFPRMARCEIQCHAEGAVEPGEGGRASAAIPEAP
jgi:hypothetical protein